MLLLSHPVEVDLNVKELCCKSEVLLHDCVISTVGMCVGVFQNLFALGLSVCVCVCVCVCENELRKGDDLHMPCQPCPLQLGDE